MKQEICKDISEIKKWLIMIMLIISCLVVIDEEMFWYVWGKNQ